MSAAIPDPRTVAVIGGGAVGMATALCLQRAGAHVSVLDPLGPGGGASYGNAGLISVEAVVPVALPGILRRVPGWLMDPLGPVTVRASYALKALPWLWQWVLAGRMDRVLQISDALRALHGPALDRYRDLLGPQAFPDVVRANGMVNVWEGDAAAKSERVYRTLWERQGVVAQPLSPEELRQLVPELARSVTRAMFLPRNGWTTNPRRLVQAMAGQLAEAGGRVLQEQVLKLAPPDGAAGWRVVSNLADRRFAKVVVAAGAFARRLLAPVGADFPLETERGYHAMFRDPGIAPRVPVLNRSRGYSITPMEEGIRIAGTVEIGGLDLPMNEARSHVLARQAKAMLPALGGRDYGIWMGFRPSLPDSLPIIGPVPGRAGLYLACGHGHTGLTAGAVTGRLMAQIVLGQPTDIDPAPYRFDRF